MNNVIRNLIGVPIAVAVLAVLTGCGGAEARTDAYAVRDSAGIRITESGAPAWGERERWHLSDEPVLTIGALEGAEPYQLHQVQGVHRLRDGTLVIGNGGTHELRFFDADGRFLHATGRKGGGPGEFERLAESYALGDTIFVYDLFQSRISAFDADGTLLRTIPVNLAEQGPRGRPVGRLPDGSWVISFHRFLGESGFVRDSLVYFRLREDGEPAQPIVTVPGNEMVIEERTSGERRMVMMDVPPFARQASSTIVGGLLAHGGADRYEITLLDGAGDVHRLIRRDHEARPVSEADLRQWDDWTPPIQPPAGAPPPAQPPKRAADYPLPPTKAAHGQIRADLAGNLWVAEYVHPYRAIPTRWSVFDADGRWLGDVTTPEALRITEIGDDYLLGVARDDLGVEYVHMFRLVKP